VGKNAAVFLIFAGLIFTSVGMHNWQTNDSQPLSFAGRKYLSLVIAVRPDCPTSRATLSEAVRICYRVPGEVKVTALVFGEDEKSISQNALFAGLAKTKARILSDADGEVARRVGLTNSAQALLFSPNGNLLYNGTITGQPDRLGNPGEEMVVEIIHGSNSMSINVPPHGCSLQAGSCAHEHGWKTASTL
jgi:hypothetical protein